MPDGSQTETCTWKGQSGKDYVYWVYPVGADFKAEPGNYIFAKRNGNGAWVAVYIGETQDLSERFASHHRYPCIARNGATHIHAHLTAGGKQSRLDEATDLRKRYQPPCNAQ